MNIVSTYQLIISTPAYILKILHLRIKLEYFKLKALIHVKYSH